MHFTAQQKHNILTHYRAGVRGAGFHALARRFDVRGGGELVRLWYGQWDGTPKSLQDKPRSGRPRVLSTAQVQQHVRAPILRANRLYHQVRYSKLLPQVQANTGKQVGLSTMRRYGKQELGARSTRGKKRAADERKHACTHESLLLQLLLLVATHKLSMFCWSFSVSAQTCEEIAKVRRKLQRFGTAHILFLDETNKREGDVESSTIVLPGEPPYIETSSTSSYAKRFDMIACCSGHTTLPPIIYSPAERGAGVTKEMLLDYIRNLLAQAAGALDTYPLILCIDRAPIHGEDEMLREFHDWGCQELVEIIKLPSGSAKRLSPLDNSLFNVWRQRVLQGGPLTLRNIKKRMSAAWEGITKADIQAQYKHCGLMRNADVYFDCPNHAQHKHAK